MVVLVRDLNRSVYKLFLLEILYTEQKSLKLPKKRKYEHTNVDNPLNSWHKITPDGMSMPLKSINLPNKADLFCSIFLPLSYTACSLNTVYSSSCWETFVFLFLLKTARSYIVYIKCKMNLFCFSLKN